MYEGDSKRIDAGLRERVEDILTILDGAKSIKELGAPAYRLHPLKGGLKLLVDGGERKLADHFPIR
jgi:hypothetical protein